jgi:hypothetical protein
MKGSVGNVYTVTIEKVPSCDCPDQMKGNICKHVLFIFIKVLKIKDISLAYQRALLSSELTSIFSHFDKCEIGRNSLPMANIKVRTAYNKILKEKEKEDRCDDIENEEDVQPQVQKEISGECQCPICCELFSNSKEEKIIFCQYGCGNNVHLSCFNEWCKVLKKNQFQSCVVCRSPWTKEEKEKKSKFDEKGEYIGDDDDDDYGYINLGKYQQDSSDHHSYKF